MGARRFYRLHVPAGYDRRVKTPLVVVLHGAFSTPRQVERESGFSELAAREGFLVAYPAGAYGLFGLFRHWNAGHCCGKAAADGVDDVGFLLRVIRDIGRTCNVDPARVYLAGFSNGGMLTYRFAAERTSVLAAAAPLAASPGGRASSDRPPWMTPMPQAPLPLIVFHARDDDSVPFEGGTSPRKGGEQEYVSVAEAAAFWVSNNGCLEEPVVESARQGRVTKKTWSDPRGGNDVVLYELEEWGHTWPGKHFTGRLDPGHPLRGFHAAEIIWEFFKKHARGDAEVTPR